MTREQEVGPGQGGRTDPLELYQRYDRINRRMGWEEALKTLRRDVQAGRQPLDREDVARQFGLSQGWDWQDVTAQIQAEPRPLEAFNSFLRTVFRGLD